MTRSGKYLAIDAQGLWHRIVFANTLKAVLKKAKIDKDSERGDFKIFRAEGDSIVEIHRNGNKV